MSEKNLPPIPKLPFYLGLRRTQDNKIGALFKSRATGIERVVSEFCVYNDMIKSAEWSRDLQETLPDHSAHYARQSNEQHRTLDELQRAILRDGQSIEAPRAQTAKITKLEF